MTPLPLWHVRPLRWSPTDKSPPTRSPAPREGGNNPKFLQKETPLEHASRHRCCNWALVATLSATEGFHSLTELRAPHAALNIVAAPAAANGVEEEGRRGRDPRAALSCGSRGDWWLAVHRWCILCFFKNHTSLLFTIKETVRWAAAAAAAARARGRADAWFEFFFFSVKTIHHKRSAENFKVVGLIQKLSPLGF